MVKKNINEYYVKWVEQIFSEEKLTPPEINTNLVNIDFLERTYSLIGLFLLMKYVNGEKDMFEWEENRRQISMKIDELLKKDKANHHKICKHCEQKMEWHSTYNICENCYKPRKKRDDWYEEDEDF